MLGCMFVRGWRGGKYEGEDVLLSVFCVKDFISNSTVV